MKGSALFADPCMILLHDQTMILLQYQKCYFMARGGKREGSGSKAGWSHGKTKPVMVPVALADKILEIARVLDDEGLNDPLIASKTIDLTGISIRQARDGAVVKLSDLVRAGYFIKPQGLMDLASRKTNSQDFELENLLYLAEKQVNE
jgi:hypothetical protein